MVHAATHVENNMGSKVEVTFCSKDKEETVFYIEMLLQNCKWILRH